MEEKNASRSASENNCKNALKQKVKEISENLDKMVSGTSMGAKEPQVMYNSRVWEILESIQRQMTNFNDDLQNGNESRKHGSDILRPMEHPDLVRSSPVVTERNNPPIRRIDRSASDTTGGSIKVVIEVTQGRVRHSYPCHMCSSHHEQIFAENLQNLNEVQIAVQHAEAQENDDTHMDTKSSRLKHAQV